MSKYIIGLDVGATKISAGLVFGDKISKLIKLPTEVQKGKKTIIENIQKAIGVFLNPKVSAIGIGIAGQVDQKKGILVSSPNMPKAFKNIPLKKIFGNRFKIPVFIENDANCFVLAESIYGQGKNSRNVIGLTLGTGIGGGIVLNKKIYHGKNGLAGELGHMTIVENGLVCSCGKKGHLEVYASGTAMINLYHRFTGQIKDTFFIEKLAIRKEKKALRVVEMMSNSLAIGIANIINTLDPDVLILGGGMIRVKIVWQPAIAKARRELIYPELKKTKILKSKLGDSAPVLGAALITEQN